MRSTFPFAAFLACSAVCAQDLYLTTASNQLVKINVGTPGTVTSSMPIQGLQTGETVLGLDARPSNGNLYAMGSTSRLYRIDVTTGMATQIGVPLVPPLNGTSFGFDFNPTVDRIRVTSNADLNLRLHPDTGAVVAMDSTLAYAVTDPFANVNPNIVASAYTNNVSGATTTTLYGIDSNLDMLVTQVPPNNGTLNTIGALGVNVGEVAGFDIAGSNGVAYAVFTSPGGGVQSSALFRIDLTTGAATFLSTIGVAEPITGMTVLPTIGAAQYGLATPGCFGNPAITATGRPTLGNAMFTIGCVNVHPNTVGRLMISGRDLVPPQAIAGLMFNVDPNYAGTLWIPVGSDAAGSNLLSLPIPNDSSLENARVFMQYAWLDRCARGIAAGSNGLALTITR